MRKFFAPGRRAATPPQGRTHFFAPGSRPAAALRAHAAAIALALVAPQAAADPTGAMFVYAHTQPIKTLDPAFITNSSESCALGNIYEGLMRFKPGSVSPELGLAEHYEISDNGRVYTFFLRKNVRFSDGSPLHAQDVVFSLQRVGFLAPFIENIFVIDAHTLQIALHEPFAPFLHYLAMPQAGIMSYEHARSIGALKDPALLAHRPMGTGPFVLVNIAERTELAANELYHRSPPRLAGVMMQYLPELRLREQSLRDGHVHAAQLNEQPRNSRGFKLLSIPGFNTLLLAFNLRNAVLASAEVREALAQSIDKKRLNEAIYANEEAEGVLPPSAFGFDIAQKGVEYSPIEGKSTLNALGYLHGFDLQLVYFTDGPVAVRSMGAAAAHKIEQDLAELSVRVHSREMSYEEYQRSGAVADLLLLQIESIYGDSDDFMRALLHYNPTGYSSGQLSKLVRVARLNMRTSEREQYYRAAQQLVTDSTAWMPLAHAREQIAVRDGVKGLIVYPLPGLCDFAQVNVLREQ